MLTEIRPEGWPIPKGYADGMMGEGRLVLTGGQIGWHHGTFETDDFVGQCEQALRNVLDIVEAAGGEARHIARLTWYVTGKAEYLARQREMGEAYRRVMGRHFPAMAMVVVAALIEDRAKVEIEGTAIL